MSEQVAKPAKGPWYRHAGSTVAIALGALAFAGGISLNSDEMISGPMLIVGALAYRSAKRRRLEEVEPTSARQLVEGIAILIVLAPFALRNDDLKAAIVVDPVSNFLVPAGCIIAYLIQAAPQWIRRK